MASETDAAETDEETEETQADGGTKPDEATVRTTADAQAGADVTKDADEGTDASESEESGGVGKATLAVGLLAVVFVLALLWWRRNEGGNHLTPPF